ncbi:uncharacterized protein EI90DRAFT_3145018 [Cantharellus anzutake]|uniref:uncharacterized protein n=1 Tax=Cantharellus anzutake TaxID=1750568 RepID=UPI001902DD95|nr:uncharacterized protein EI90DRAFT_3145018 [Cantharellus anzutake]KAF8333994.1 hypothetical protein EI90DRAFT_3145018 [Cantharellus anzutake]
MKNLFIGSFVDTPQLGKLRIVNDQALLVDEQGNIAGAIDVDEAVSLSDNPQIQTFRVPTGSFLIPTFCDLHLHAPQYLYLGTGLHLPLMEWLNEYAFKAEEKIDDDPEGLGHRVYSSLANRLIRSGTGAALLFGTICEESNLVLAETFQSAGLRGFIGKLSMDKSSRPTYVEASSDASLSAAERFIHRCRDIVKALPANKQFVEPVLTPRFVPTCSDELLSGLGRLASKHGVKIQSHLAEARDQVNWVKLERGVDDIDVFDRSSLLTSRTVQAHCTFLDPSSLVVLHEKGTAIAHCPLSNVYFSSQPFRLREALDLGVNVGLGSDVAGGYTADIMNAMRQAVIASRIRESYRSENEQEIQRTQPLEGSSSQSTNQSTTLAVHWTEALYLATKGGAEALGLSSGSFIPGAAFDAQQISLIDNMSGKGIGQLDFFEPVTNITEDLIEKWWCLGNEQNRTGVWVQGCKLL